MKMSRIEKTMENMELAMLRLRLYLESRMEECRDRIFELIKVNSTKL